MNLIAPDDTFVTQYIPAMSIEYMLENNPQYFSQHCLPPIGSRLLKESGERQSYEVQITRPESGRGWRMANIRETLWLWIWNERFERFRINQKILRTSTRYVLPCQSHLPLTEPVLLVDLQDTTVRVRAEYPNVINKEYSTSFWLRPNP